ncbi:disks large-associated protein 4 isoform X5 [Hylobates moloch]|uniref:disks large-associated protein 4 isoform X6 n=1 Tax=Symphalangus syndactylus TaxID=9590 RepID=UPI0024416C4D|nr:disks large-associated protein 4 isoform X6 [Symphalangus syndactylus]XP_058289136.1 disks large-associated protein 4 isoform X5 [Hylobates moloch]
MKGLGDSRPRHLSDSLDPPHEPLFAGTDRNPYLLSPTEAFAREARFPGQNTLPGDGLFPLNNQLPPPSSTFPRIHYNSHFEVPEESPFPSHAQATKINRLPANLLDQFEKQLPIHRDGFSTLQFPRGEAKARGESPGRIRHLVHSVQRLFFTKAPSLEGTAGKVGGNGSKKGGMEDGKGRRAKSKERAKAGEPKRRSRSNISGWWSSDDNLDGEAGAFRSSGPASGLMTLGRQAERSQPRYFMHAYNTISGHMLKATKNNTTELTAPPPPPAPPATCPSLGVGTDTNYVKRGSWSTLTLSHAHEVCQKTSATLDKSLLKSKSCHQGLAYHYLQVPGGGGEWSTTLLSPRETDAAAEGPIPCRRMRSGSYIKAMGDEDSDESGGSPKPSPKTAARRQSYLRATQQSLGEQSNPRRSLDRLDSVDMLLPSKCPSWEEDYTPVSDSLNDSSCISQIFGQASLIPQLFGHEQQVREAELSDQYEAACESACSEAESTAAETLDLPLPSYFRSRSHSYLRAIQAGCSQEEDSVSLQSLSPPPSTGSLSNSRTLPSSSCLVAYKKTPPPVPPRTTSKPFISVTVQSSTESAQDTYLDSQDHKSEERTRRNGSHLSEDNGPKAIDVMAPSSESSVPSHSMSSRRDTDSDTQDANDSSCKSSERSLPDCTPHPNSISIDAGPRQAPKIAQIKRNLSYGDNSDPALEASSLPPPDPWLETSSSSPAEPAQPGACRRDGYWFLKLLQAETERLEGWCCQMDKETKENNLSEEVLGKVLSAVGSAQLLMSQKFQQFRGLCEQNLNPDANPRPTAQDLAGFWDLLQLSIEDISMKFDELYHLKANSWQLVETPEKRKEEKKPPPPVPKKPAKSKPAVSRDKASDASDKQRQEARKRLLAAKRAASVRQNSATESADSIEIYVPEAQTRL